MFSLLQATADVLIYLNNVNERAPVFQGADKYVIDLKEVRPTWLYSRNLSLNSNVNIGGKLAATH